MQTIGIITMHVNRVRIMQQVTLVSTVRLIQADYLSLFLGIFELLEMPASGYSLFMKYRFYQDSETNLLKLNKNIKCFYLSLALLITLTNKLTDPKLLSSPVEMNEHQLAQIVLKNPEIFAKQCRKYIFPKQSKVSASATLTSQENPLLSLISSPNQEESESGESEKDNKTYTLNGGASLSKIDGRRTTIFKENQRRQSSFSRYQDQKQEHGRQQHKRQYRTLDRTSTVQSTFPHRNSHFGGNSVQRNSNHRTIEANIKSDEASGGHQSGYVPDIWHKQRSSSNRKRNKIFSYKESEANWRKSRKSKQNHPQDREPFVDRKKTQKQNMRIQVQEKELQQDSYSDKKAAKASDNSKQEQDSLKQTTKRNEGRLVRNDRIEQSKGTPVNQLLFQQKQGARHETSHYQQNNFKSTINRQIDSNNGSIALPSPEQLKEMLSKVNRTSIRKQKLSVLNQLSQARGTSSVHVNSYLPEPSFFRNNYHRQTQKHQINAYNANHFDRRRFSVHHSKIIVHPPIQMAMSIEDSY